MNLETSIKNTSKIDTKKFTKIYDALIKRIKIAIIIGLSCSLVLIAEGIISIVCFESNSKTTLVCGILILAAYIVLLVKTIQRRKGMIELYEKNRNFLYEYDFSNDEILINTENATGNQRYDSLFLVYEKKDFWVLYFGTRHASQMLMILKDGFQKSEDNELFRNFLMEKIGKKKVKSH